MSTKAAAPAVTLEYVKTIGIVNNGDNGRGFANPYDIAVTRDGRICVLNRCDPPRAASIRIGICNLDEEYLDEFGLGYGDGDGQVTLPVCLAFDSRERLYVTDENNHRVSVFDLSGKFLGKWGSRGSGDGELDGAAGIAIDSNDDVYVADQHNHRIQKFDRDGAYLSQWGGHGNAAGQLDMPWGLAVDGEDNVYVADWRNDRVQKFSSEGRFLTSFGEPGRGDSQFHRPSGVAVDADGNIYVSDWGNERLQVLRPRRLPPVERARPRHAVEVGEGVLRLQPGRDVDPGAVGPDIGAARAPAGAVPRVVADGALFLGPDGGIARLRGQGLHTRDEPPPLPGIPAQVGLASADGGSYLIHWLAKSGYPSLIWARDSSLRYANVPEADAATVPSGSSTRPSASTKPRRSARFSATAVTGWSTGTGLRNRTSMRAVIVHRSSSSDTRLIVSSSSAVITPPCT